MGRKSAHRVHGGSAHPRRASSRSVGHKGKFGHEFMEFEFRPDGRLRYANNSNYKNDAMIRKECECTRRACKGLLPRCNAAASHRARPRLCSHAGIVSKSIIEELKRMIRESEMLK